MDTTKMSEVPRGAIGRIESGGIRTGPLSLLAMLHDPLDLVANSGHVRVLADDPQSMDHSREPSEGMKKTVSACPSHVKARSGVEPHSPQEAEGDVDDDVGAAALLDADGRRGYEDCEGVTSGVNQHARAAFILLAIRTAKEVKEDVRVRGSVRGRCSVGEH